MDYNIARYSGTLELDKILEMLANEATLAETEERAPCVRGLVTQATRTALCHAIQPPHSGRRSTFLHRSGGRKRQACFQ